MLGRLGPTDVDPAGTGALLTGIVGAGGAGGCRRAPMSSALAGREADGTPLKSSGGEPPWCGRCGPCASRAPGASTAL